MDKEREQEADLERDLIDDQRIKDLVRESREFGQRLYAALCNIKWVHDATGRVWTCSWRYAGGVVSALGTRAGGYLEYYCSGGEGAVADDVEAELKRLGWSWKEWEPEQAEDALLEDGLTGRKSWDEVAEGMGLLRREGDE